MVQGMAGAVSTVSLLRLLYGFVAGFLVTLVFHQIGIYLLHTIGMTPSLPYDTGAVPPFGVPRFLSLAFWGGVWGIVFVLVEPYLARSPGGYWIRAVVFGAVFPTLVAWFLVLPAKGLPAAGGFRFPGLLVGPIVNGLWGFGTWLLLEIIPRAFRR
jgi:hypothetical protein